MRFHFRVSDPSVVPWVPVCKRRVLAIYNSGVRWYDRFEDWGLFIVQMRINNEEVYVNLMGKGEAYFEFQTTGLPVQYWYFNQGGISGQAYNVGVVGVSISKGVATPKLLGGKRVGYPGAIAVSRIKRQNQVILLDEPVHYYSTKTNPKSSQHYARMLYDAWAPLHPHTGLHFHSYGTIWEMNGVHTLLGSFSSHYLRDIGYDVAWNDNVEFGALREAILPDAADWPRKTGLQQVTSTQYGTREFAIYVDAFDQVSVFPTSQIGEPKTENGMPLQNVDPLYVKTERVPLPSWCYKKTQTFRSWYETWKTDTSFKATGLYDFPEHDWKIHPDGTYMCAVVYEHELAVFNDAYFSPFATDITTQGPGTFFPDQTSFDLLNAFTMGVNALNSGTQTPGDPYYTSAPGLVEASIDIVLTGPGPEDFTLTVNCYEVRRPTTSQYCTFLAGYCWFDIKATSWTKEEPVYDARRGDLCVLDLELYGRLSDVKAADLYALKNLTQSKEIRTFAATSAYTAGSLFTGMASVLAYNFETLSFVFKVRNIEVVTDSGWPKHTLHFGVVVYTLNRYQHTFFPSIMEAAQQTAILNKVDVDMRAAMVAEFGTLDLMPLNDLADWTSSRLQRLRERYCRSLTESGSYYDVDGDGSVDPYSGNTTPYANQYAARDMVTGGGFGYKYWKTGSFDYPAPTTDDYNWYNHVFRHGIARPFCLFDLETPRPGWWQHSQHILRKCEINPHTTFFTHPNGTWALFNQSLMYNKNGIHLVGLGTTGLGTSEWDAANMEHCIFDRVHFSVWGSNSTNSTINTSFRELYNEAITRGIDDKTLTDNSSQIALNDMRVTFTPGTIADPYDATVTYAQMQITWPSGYNSYYREILYFSGAKGAGGSSYYPGVGGGALDLSLSTMWKAAPEDGAALLAPEVEHTPITFSTCVMITR